jgi:hypothetical protein
MAVAVYVVVIRQAGAIAGGLRSMQRHRRTVDDLGGIASRDRAVLAAGNLVSDSGDWLAIHVGKCRACYHSATAGGFVSDTNAANYREHVFPSNETTKQGLAMVCSPNGTMVERHTLP